MEHTKHTRITYEIRDTMLRLSNAGLKAPEIAPILNVSQSSVSYTLQCYKAVESEEWETVRRLTISQSSGVRWALDKLGKTLPDDLVDEQDSTSAQQEPAPVYARMDERFDEIQKSLNGIGFLLSEILSELRG